jgi:hypothetical protein
MIARPLQTLSPMMIKSGTLGLKILCECDAGLKRCRL